MCAACSLGNDVGAYHEHRTPEVWSPARRLGVAAKSPGDLHPLRHAGRLWRPEVESVDQVL
jgi:hypothetical protein